MVKVVIAGGGIGALEALLAIRDLAEKRVELTVVTPESVHEIEALAPAAVLASAPSGRIPLEQLCASADADLVGDRVVSLDAAARVLVCASGQVVAYDTAVLAVGARRTRMAGADLTYAGSASRQALTRILQELRDGAGTLAIVVPDDAGWSLPAYELALLIGRRSPQLTISVHTFERGPLEIFGPGVCADARRLLADAGIRLETGLRPVAVDGGVRVAPDGEPIVADRIIALPHVLGPALAGVPRDTGGFIPVSARQRVQGAEHVYAVGDCTAFPVKQGGLAAQQADVAAAAIARGLGAPVDAATFRAVLRGKLMTGDGDQYFRNPALSWDGAGRMHAHELWWPPSKVWGHYLPQWLTGARIPI